MSSKGLRTAVGKMLPPLVRILRNGMAAKSFHELVKQAYVSVALDEFGIGGRAATTSRIAILGAGRSPLLWDPGQEGRRDAQECAAGQGISSAVASQ